MKTNPTTPIRTPAMSCSSRFQGPRHPLVLPNAASHEWISWPLPGNGHALSCELANPQHLNASCIALIPSTFFCENIFFQLSSSPQSRPEAGAACVPSNVMTTDEYMKMIVFAMMTRGGRTVSPRGALRRRSCRLVRS